MKVNKTMKQIIHMIFCQTRFQDKQITMPHLFILASLNFGKWDFLNFMAQEK